MWIKYHENDLISFVSLQRHNWLAISDTAVQCAFAYLMLAKCETPQELGQSLVIVFFFFLLVCRCACMPAWPHFLIDILELFLHWTAMLRVIVKFAWTTNYSYCTRTFQPISFEIPTPNCFKNKSTFSLPQIEIHRKQIVTKSQFPIINFIRVAVFHRVSWRKKILPMTFCSLIRSNWATINDKRYNKTNSNSK